MNRRFLSIVAAPAVLATALALTACGGKSGGSAPSVPPSDSAQVSVAASAASQLAEKCQPKGETTQAWEVALLLHKSDRQAFYTCEAIPKGDDDAVASCALTAAENAHKASGTSASKETGFISALSACVSSLGATASPSASASTS